MSTTKELSESFEILWVKVGQLFWPGQVWPESRWDSDLKEDIEEAKRKPITVVKFFNEDGYEFLYDKKNVYPYNCDKKEEFIMKGVVKSRTKSKEGATGGWFAKFPKDIVLCEEMIGGDPDILEKDPFVERNEKVNYKEVFGTPDDKNKKNTTNNSSNRKRKLAQSDKKEPPNKRPIVHPRFLKGKISDHTVKILPQPSTPYHLDLIKSQEKDSGGSNSLLSAPESAVNSGKNGASAGAAPVGKYTCQMCDFSASRINVIVLHQKTHSESNNLNAKNNSKSPMSARRSTPATTTTAKAKTPSSAKSRATKRPASTTPMPSSSSTPAPTAPKRRGGKTPATPTSPVPATPKQVATTNPKRSSARKQQVNVVVEETESPKKRKETLATKKSVEQKKGQKMTPKKRREKKKQEIERKEEERKKILGDWSEGEEGEEIEKRKIKDVLEEPFVDSSEEEENDDWMLEDNIQGNVYKDDEEEEEQKQQEKLNTEGEENNEKDPKVQEKPAQTNEEGTKKIAETNGEEAKQKKEADEFDFDIGKVLEETSVPNLPTVSEFKAKSKARKSVSFAEKPKEIVTKNVALVENPESQLEAPPMIDDEFDEFVTDYELPTSPPKVYAARKIVTKRAEEEVEENSKSSEVGKLDEGTVEEYQPDPEEEEDDEETGKAEESEKAVKNTGPQKEVAKAVAADWDDDEEEEEEEQQQQQDKEQQQQDKEKQEESEGDLQQTTPGSNLADLADLAVKQAEAEQQQQQQEANTTESLGSNASSVEGYAAPVVTTTAVTTTASNGQEETYLILVDDGSGSVDNLNSQTLYIDPAQFGNGDLSNMVLMTNEGVTLSAQTINANSTHAPVTEGQHMLAAHLAETAPESAATTTTITQQ